MAAVISCVHLAGSGKHYFVSTLFNSPLALGQYSLLFAEHYFSDLSAVLPYNPTPHTHTHTMCVCVCVCSILGMCLEQHLHLPYFHASLRKFLVCLAAIESNVLRLPASLLLTY